MNNLMKQVEDLKKLVKNKPLVADKATFVDFVDLNPTIDNGISMHRSVDDANSSRTYANVASGNVVSGNYVNCKNQRKLKKSAVNIPSNVIVPPIADRSTSQPAVTKRSFNLLIPSKRVDGKLTHVIEVLCSCNLTSKSCKI